MNWWIISIVIYILGVLIWYFISCYQDGHVEHGEMFFVMEEGEEVCMLIWPIVVPIIIATYIIGKIFHYPFLLVEKLVSFVLRVKRPMNVKKIIK